MLVQGIGVFGMLLVAFKGTLGPVILPIVIYNFRYDGKGFCFTAYWCLLKGVKERFMLIQREMGTWGKILHRFIKKKDENTLIIQPVSLS